MVGQSSTMAAAPIGMPYNTANTASTYTGVPVPQSVAGMIYSLEQLPHEHAQTDDCQELPRCCGAGLVEVGVRWPAVALPGPAGAPRSVLVHAGAGGGCGVRVVRQ
jgi:hypothetical protein